MDDDEDCTGKQDSLVRLYIYDLSKGLAKVLSPAVLGKQLDGIWHTSLVVYGREYFYGSGGIESVRPGGTVLGRPNDVLELGQTQIPYSLFLEYIFSLGETSYTPQKYHLFKHNCNNFTQEVGVFLTGKGIPEYVLNLPAEVLNTPLGESLRTVLEPVSLRVEGGRGVKFGSQTVQDAEERAFHNPVDNSTGDADFDADDDDIREIMETIQLSKEESEKSKKDQAAKSVPSTNGETNLDEDAASDGNSWEKKLAAKRAQKNQDPPIIFKDIEAESAFAKLEETIKGSLNEDETQLLRELQEFIITDSGAWALGGQHLEFISKLLTDKSLSKEVRKSMLQFLQAAALKEDVILLLHMDRKEHLLMNYINDFEKMDEEEREEIAKLVCNLCLPYSSSDWLLYISEWQAGSQTCSNSRVTTRVAVDSLLSEKPSLQEKGVALMYNLGLKEVFDDTATELASAILQFLHGNVDEDPAYKVLIALHRFMQISYKDVPALVKMLGPDLGKFKGKSDRLDHLVEQVIFKSSTVGVDSF